MGLLDNLITQDQPQTTSPQVGQSSWVQDLIARRTDPANKRIKRNPVGFNFTRDPYDPSSFYSALQKQTEVSQLATNVAKQEQANKQASILAAEQAANQAALQGALNGINSPGYQLGQTFAGVSKKYGLKHISSNTSKAADFWGSKYGIKTIGGYASHGSVPNSDHPKGLALDFMINNVKNGTARGTALANDIIKNYKAWNVKYVIWNRYIWQPGRGWKKYNGPSPHTDHVHVSFNK